MVSVWIKLDRPEALAAEPSPAKIEIQDGQFTLQDFPYPLRKAMEKSSSAMTPSKTWTASASSTSAGRGPEGGPNANSTSRSQLHLGPLDQVAGSAPAESTFMAKT